MDWLSADVATLAVALGSPGTPGHPVLHSTRALEHLHASAERRSAGSGDHPTSSMLPSLSALLGSQLASRYTWFPPGFNVLNHLCIQMRRLQSHLHHVTIASATCQKTLPKGALTGERRALPMQPMMSITGSSAVERAELHNALSRLTAMADISQKRRRGPRCQPRQCQPAGAGPGRVRAPAAQSAVNRCVTLQESKSLLIYCRSGAEDLAASLGNFSPREWGLDLAEPLPHEDDATQPPQVLVDIFTFRCVSTAAMCVD